jgi:hypothetical protein
LGLISGYSPWPICVGEPVFTDTKTLLWEESTGLVSSMEPNATIVPSALIATELYLQLFACEPPLLLALLCEPPL